jgi:hypothetical protein
MNNSFVHMLEGHKVTSISSTCTVRKNQQIHIQLCVLNATVVNNKFIPNVRIIWTFIRSLLEIHLILTKGIFPLNFQIKFLCAFLISPTCTSCPFFIIINFITVNIQCLSPWRWKLWSTSTIVRAVSSPNASFLICSAVKNWIKYFRSKMYLCSKACGNLFWRTRSALNILLRS